MTVIETVKDFSLIENLYKNYFEIMGKINTDYCLIKYLTDIFFMNTVTEENEYLKLKRKDGSKTTLHRIILEFYSQYSPKLRALLNDSKYEINHKNKDRKDNRLENLEILTHNNNMLHKNCKKYNVEMSSSELILISKNIINTSLYNKNKKYLEKVDQEIKNCQDDRGYDLNKWCRNKYINNYCYEFSNIKKDKQNNKYKYSESKKKDNLKPNIFLTNSNIAYKIETVILNYNNTFILNEIFKTNFSKLKRYVMRYQYLQKIIVKYKVLKVLGNLKGFLIDCGNSFQIIDDNIIFTYPMKEFLWNIRAKYKILKVTFLLGLLNMQTPIKINHKYKLNIYQPTTISIPIYTDDLLKNANNMAKKVIKLNLNKITYFIIREEFGQEVTDNIYKNKNYLLQIKYEKYKSIKEDVIDILNNNQNLKLYGYCTFSEIYNELVNFNEYKKNNNEKFNKISHGINEFICCLFKYNTDFNSRVNCVHKNFNKKIKKKVLKYYEKNNIDYKISNISNIRCKYIISKNML